MRGRIYIASAFVMFMCIMCAPSYARPDNRLAIKEFISKISSCVASKDIITLGVLGIKNNDDRFSDEKISRMRSKVEVLLQQEGVRLKPINDMGEILNSLQYIKNDDINRKSSYILKAKDVDAYIYFNIFDVKTNKYLMIVKMRLVGISRDLECKVSSNNIEIQIKINTLYDFNKKFNEIINYVFDNRAEDVKNIFIGPFLTPQGYESDCNKEIRGLVIKSIMDYNQSANMVLNEKKRLVILNRIKDKEKYIYINGIIKKIENYYKVNIIITKRDNLNSHNRNELIGEWENNFNSLHCNMNILDFTTKIIFPSKHNNSIFFIYPKKTYAILNEDNVEFHIISKKHFKLYCLVVDSIERDGYILFPRAGLNMDNTINKGEEKIYPSGFGFREQIYRHISDNLFGCFAVQGDLPAEVNDLWMAMSNRKEPLKQGDIELLIKQMRTTKGMVEHWAKVLVVKNK